MNKLLLSAAFLALVTPSVAATPNRCQPNSHLPDGKCTKREPSVQLKGIEMKGVSRHESKPDHSVDPGTDCEHSHDDHEHGNSHDEHGDSHDEHGKDRE